MNPYAILNLDALASQHISNLHGRADKARLLARLKDVFPTAKVRGKRVIMLHESCTNGSEHSTCTSKAA
jgi:hypothetical protein